MTTYVLVHGAWHGGWCWHRVAAHLERGSHRVIAPDLKSLGRDRTPPRQTSLAAWADQIASLARSLLVSQATLPFATPVHVSAGRFGRVPRAFIECSADRAITHVAQRRMRDRLPCRERITLDADHSPFLCRSEELAAVLQRF